MRDTFLKRCATAAALVAGLVLAPSLAAAQADVGAAEEDLDEAVEEELESGDAAEKPWSISATLVNRVYQGVFSNLENQDPELSPGKAADPAASFDRWLNVYVISPSYKLDDFSFAGEVIWTHWLTPGGGLNGPYEFRFDDISLSASWSGYTIEAIDTNVSASYSLGLPTSDVSQTSSLIVSNSLSGSVSRTFFDKLSLSYSLAGSWLPHQSTSPTGDVDVVDIYRENERHGDRAVIGGLNTEFALTNSLAASFTVWEDLSLSASYALTKYWTVYQDNDDEFTPRGVEGINTGRSTVDILSTSVNLSHPIGEYVSLSGGIRTQMQPKTSDSHSLRFPFWDMSGAPRNSSARQIAGTGSY